MKKSRSPLFWIFAVIGLVVSFCCIGGGFVLFAGWRQVSQKKDSAYAWLDPTLKTISKDWSAEGAKPYVVDGFDATSIASYREAFGPVKTLNTPYGFYVNAGTGQGLTIRLEFDGTFEKGPGTVRAVLVETNGKYKISRLHVYKNKSDMPVESGTSP